MPLPDYVKQLVVNAAANSFRAFAALLQHCTNLLTFLFQSPNRMEYLNKLNKFRSTLSTTVESTVFSTVSTITNALPGNPVTRDYEVFEHVASGGPGKSLQYSDGTYDLP